MDKEELIHLIKVALRDALNERESKVEYLHSPDSDQGRYYCSKPNCEGVRFQTKDNNENLP